MRRSAKTPNNAAAIDSLPLATEQSFSVPYTRVFVYPDLTEETKDE